MRYKSLGLIVLFLVLFFQSSIQINAQTYTLVLSESDAYGQILTDSEGNSLYIFSLDAGDDSNCNDECAAVWPPLTAPYYATLTGGPGVDGKLSTILRDDTRFQVTYDGNPLYYFSGDEAPGEVNGHGINEVWYVGHPNRGEMAVANPVINDVAVYEVGDILVNQGFALYTFANDTAGTSNCSGACAEAFPPFVLHGDGGEPILKDGLPGRLGTISRDGGAVQVTYNDQPLYFHSEDKRPGETNGVNDVWHLVAPVDAPEPAVEKEIVLNEVDQFGTILTNRAGRTIYIFTADEGDQSNCNGGCAETWPPVLLADGETLAAGAGLDGTLSTIEREDGTDQVTYDGNPLYYYFQDFALGEVTGHGIGGVWFVAHPDRASMTVKNPVIRIEEDDFFGDYFTNQGYTLYHFKEDEPGVSNCNGGCAEVWPPLLVGAGGAPELDGGIVGNIGTLIREDGAIQVTYNELPLYFYAPDLRPRDLKGQGVGDVWFILNPFEPAPLPAPRVIVSETESFGKILTNGSGRTIYIFTADGDTGSACNGGCAETWPPVLVDAGVTPTGGPGVTGELGTLIREDGTTQVTYDGNPLYYYFQDFELNEVTGHGIGGVWYVAHPSRDEMTIDDLVIRSRDAEGLGTILTAQGYTVYQFLDDAPNTSTCNGGCAAVWPPVLAGDGVVTLDGGVPGAVGTMAREDGSTQVTYNDIPLYYYAPDLRPNDTKGQGVGDVWFVINPEDVDPAPAPRVIVSETESFGKILTNGSGRTIYIFTVDGDTGSACNGGCAETWPPVLVDAGVTPTGGPGVTGELGTLIREDGTTQVTYDGNPLYYYFQDFELNEVTGHGIGGVWYVAHPSRDEMTIDDLVIRSRDAEGLGTILTAQGYTLYQFLDDAPNTSTCNGGCAAVWPPVLAGDGVVTLDSGVPGTVGTMTREDGSTQVTYNDIPLYYYSPDLRPNDTKGQGVGDVWFVINPEETVAADADVIATENDELGTILTDRDGNTLYLFTVDGENVSTCNAGCDTVWPPLTVEPGTTPTAGPGLPGSLSTFMREDGQTQVAYNGIPLYFYAEDDQPGDTNGQGIGDVWFVVHPSVAEMNTRSVQVGATNGSEDGSYLVSEGFTLYTYTLDEPGVSNCLGSCANAWPPLLIEAGAQPALAAGVPGEIGVITRQDGSRQVTYNEMPLYYYVADQRPGATAGEGINSNWYLVTPRETAQPSLGFNLYLGWVSNGD